MHKKWKRLGCKTVYKRRVHILEYDVELPDGSKSKYEVDHSVGRAVAVLIKTIDNKVILSHQYRFPVDEWIYDLPGGGANDDETLEEAAARECREEIGIEPHNLQKIATFFPNPGRNDWAVTIFLCDHYTENKFKIINNPSEMVDSIVISLSDLKKLINNGSIIDPSLLIGWYTACAKGFFDI